MTLQNNQYQPAEYWPYSFIPSHRISITFYPFSAGLCYSGPFALFNRDQLVARQKLLCTIEKMGVGAGCICYPDFIT